MTYAFHFDSNFCSGCKACQAACKDKNNLPVGVLWRRVVEVSGGTWQNVGNGSPNPVWKNTVFAYNLSMACNHCIHPKCAGVCPVDAYDVRDDGIVILDTTKCIGCCYCAWACPYGAPQYNPQAGHMTKCDFCLDQLEQGLPPACVAACPMRVLDCGEAEPQNSLALWDAPAETHPFPLPAFSHTQPRLAIKPHVAMQTSQEKSVANLEEIRPRTPSVWEEAPLMIFTLLGQLAVGGFWILWIMTDRFTPPWNLIPNLVIGTCLGVGLLASFAHLGTKRNAWRVLAHLSHSWLSREILFAGLFGLGWLSTLLLSATRHQIIFEAMALTSILGIGLVYSMGQVYRIPAAPGWNTWWTNASFMISAMLLGLSVMFLVLSNASTSISFGAIIVLLLVQLILMKNLKSDHIYHRTRIVLIFMGMMTAAACLFQSPTLDWIDFRVFLFVAMEEVLGRWLFYRSRMG